MPLLTPLQPSPAVHCPGGVDLVVLDAARTERGLLATVQAVNGRVLVVRQLYLIDRADVLVYSQEVGAFGYTSAADVVAHVRELVPLTEACLRAAPVDEAALPWQPPIPLQMYVVPTFPTAALPAWMRDMVLNVAEYLQVPADLPAMIGLAVLAAACATKIVVEVREGYVEPVNLYTLVSLPPGNRKTPAFEAMAAPLVAYEKKATAESGPAIAEATTRHSVLEKMLTKATSSAAGSKPAQRGVAMDEAAAIARDLAEFDVPVQPRLLADDVTPERLASLLCEHHGRIAVLSPEGDVFDVMAGRYSKGSPNLSVYLKGHAGDTLRVDRVGRAAEFVAHPALTIGVAVQPEVLRGLAAQPTFRGRGLLGRFLYALPVSPLGTRDVDAPPADSLIRATYELHVDAVLALSYATDEHGERGPHTIRLDAEAQAVFWDFARWLEPQLAPGGSLGAMTDWAAKLVGAVARLAGLLHCGHYGASLAPWARPCSTDTMQHAIDLARYFIPHARAAFGEMGTDACADGARHIVGWLDRKRPDAFRKADAFRDLHRRFPKPEDLDASLSLLCEHNYLRELVPTAKRGPGRKPSATFVVNPLYLESLGAQHDEEMA